MNVDKETIIEIALQWNDVYSESVYSDTVLIPLKVGTHLTGLRGALTRVVNQLASNDKGHKI